MWKYIQLLIKGSVVRMTILVFAILFSNTFLASAYDPSAAANYANSWYNARNVPMYNDYSPNDCANFVSQCLIAGGLSLSAGTDGRGTGVDKWGCIYNCDDLNVNLISYQNTIYSGHLTSGYPSSFNQGDVVIFGNNSTDYWKHTGINVSTGTPAIDAHTNDRYEEPVSFFYPGGSPKFQSADFYHFGTNISSVSCNNDNSCNPLPITVSSSCRNSSCSTIGATTQAIPFNGENGQAYKSGRYDDDVWFSITPSNSNSVTVNVTPTSNLSNFDVVVGLYSGSCSSPTQLSAADSHGVGVAESLTFNPTPGTTYLIRVFSYGISSSTYSGNFDICATQAENAQPNLTKLSNSLSTGTNSITLNVTVQNTGAATAAASRIGYYLSNSPDSFDYDYLIGSSSIPSILSGGSSAPQNISINLCGMGIPDGTYYVGYYIDDQFAVSESSENDNGWIFSSAPITLNCTNTATITNASISPTTLCPGGTFVITDNINTSAAISNVLLGASIRQTGTSTLINDASDDILTSLSSGSSSPTRNFVVPSDTPPGTYDVLVALWNDSNGNGVIDPSDQQLGQTLIKSGMLTIAAGKPAAVTVNGPSSSCDNATITASGGDGGTIYWQGLSHNGTSMTTPATSEIVYTSGTYYFRAYNDCGGWGDEGSIVVTINEKPMPVTVSGGGTSCDNVTLTASGGDGGTIYWQGTTSNGTSTATPSTSQTVTQSGTYYFRAHNDCGWGDENSATVVISTIAASVNISADATTICSGNPVTFTASNINNIPSANYQWELNGANVGTNSSTYVNSGLSNGDIVTCVITSSSSCVIGSPATSDPITITVNSPPVATLSAVGTTVLSPGGNVVLQAASGAGYTYQWFVDNNEIPGFSGSTYTATTIGSYTVKIASNGCSVISQPVNVTSQFTLPNTNFQITVTSEPCNGDHNGSINIVGTELFNYTATVNETGSTYTFTNTKPALIGGLAAGTYTICITVDGQPDYQQCYSVVITQPQPLSVYDSVDQSNNDLNLALSGGNQYNITLNGKQYTTSANNITLPLQAGDNNLEVTTDKLCQGTFAKIISVLNRIIPYPVPFQNVLKLNLGNQNINNVHVEIHTVTDGQVVYSNKYANQSGVLQLDLTNLKNGIYALHLSLDGREKVFKVIKE